MQKAVKLYYKATSWFPRALPQTKEDIDHVKQVFTQAFGLEDSHQVWYTLFANMASVKGSSMRVSYGSLANIAKRLDINKLLQDQKQLEYETHMDILKAKAEKILNEAGPQTPADPDEPLMPSGPSDT